MTSLPYRSEHDRTTNGAAGPPPGEPAPPDATVQAARARLQCLTERWQRRRAIAALLVALAAALPIAAIGWRFGAPSARAPFTLWVLLPGAVVLAAGAGFLFATRRPARAAAVAAHLDRVLPALGESAALLLAEDLPPLQRLQRRRTAVALLVPGERELARTLPWRPIVRALLALAVGAAIAATAIVAPVPRTAAAARATSTAAPRSAAAPTPLLRSVQVAIAPPAYTGRPSRVTQGLGATVEEGSTVRWRIDARPPVTGATLLLDEVEPLALRVRPDGIRTTWLVARAPRLLRLVLSGPRGELWRSPPARLDVVADRPPLLELLAPARTVVERAADRPAPIAVELALADDYGVARAELVVTTAAGRGEQVTFAERRLPLPARRTPARQVVRRALDLEALGFTAESELYVRAEVRDARAPEPNLTRSATVVVRPPGSDVESAPLGAGLPLIAGPELFRSQRQIVLDTQRLIAVLPRLAGPEVLRRSRSIAFDQRALRMRYGTLLGQEVEDGRAPDDESEAPRFRDPSAVALGGVAEEVDAELRHEHDSAESAEFFTDPVRRKLKAMLGAMWDAEGALATGAPRRALPRELAALALLKQVQQADRVYVRKAGSEGAPLDPARRLTGELAGVHDLDARGAPPPPQPVVEAALRLLDALAAGSPSSHRMPLAGPLRQALAERARAGSASALAALPVLDALGGGASPSAAARQTLERALWQLVPPPETPIRREAPGDALWRVYRERLGGAS